MPRMAMGMVLPGTVAPVTQAVLMQAMQTAPTAARMPLIVV